MKSRGGRNQVNFLCNKQEYRRNQERDKRHEEGRDERLKNFTLVRMTIKVLFLERCFREGIKEDRDKSHQSWPEE